MTSSYTHILDLARETEPPADGILSRTVFQDDRLKAVVFGFGQGQELSEHTAAKPAKLYFVKGEAKLTLDDDTVEGKLGTWVHMRKGMRHSIQAKTSVVMLLLLLKLVVERLPQAAQMVVGRWCFLRALHPWQCRLSERRAGIARRHTPCCSFALEPFREIKPMTTDFKRGDHVEWSSEAGLVQGTIQKKVTSEIIFKGYKRHASKEEPQYIIKSDKTDHLAIHKGSALKKIKTSAR